MEQQAPFSPLLNLKKAAEKASSADERQEKIDRLSDAFEQFSLQTARLESAYSTLSHEFALTTHYLDSILCHMAQGLVFIQSGGVVTAFNPAAERLLSVKRSAVMGKPWHEGLHHFPFGFSIEEALKGALPSHPIHCKWDTEEGARLLEIELTLVQGETVEGLILLIRDRTEIHELHVAAERANRLKELGEMASLMAHEIRNPLAGIRGFASLLIRDLKDNPQAQGMAEHIVTGVDTLNHFLSRILHFSRPLSLELKEIDLKAIIEEVLFSVKQNPSFQHVTLSIHFPPGPILIHADADLFQSVLFNLLINAAQAIPEKGNITLSLKITNEQIILIIEDTGVGIPHADLEKIFKPFFTTKPNGNGFGLAEVHRIIEECKGTIHVDSTCGKGTCFTIKLPKKMDPL